MPRVHSMSQNNYLACTKKYTKRLFFVASHFPRMDEVRVTRLEKGIFEEVPETQRCIPTTQLADELITCNNSHTSELKSPQSSPRTLARPSPFGIHARSAHGVEIIHVRKDEATPRSLAAASNMWRLAPSKWR